MCPTGQLKRSTGSDRRILHLRCSHFPCALADKKSSSHIRDRSFLLCMCHTSQAKGKTISDSHSTCACCIWSLYVGLISGAGRCEWSSSPKYSLAALPCRCVQGNSGACVAPRNRGRDPRHTRLFNCLAEEWKIQRWILVQIRFGLGI